MLTAGGMLPKKAYAQSTPGYVTGYDVGQYSGVNSNNTFNSGYNYTNSGYGYGYNNNYYNGNPTPRIYSINPNTVDRKLGSAVVVITGDGFVPGAMVKLNGVDQITNYINSSRIEMRLNDLARMSVGSFIVNVYNPTPGGGFSNSATLNINDSTTVYSGPTNPAPIVSSANKTTTVAKKPTTTTVAVAKKTTDTSKDGALAASAIFGISSFLPSNLIQWLILLIFILLLVCLWRMIYVTDKDREKPLKHH